MSSLSLFQSVTDSFMESDSDSDSDDGLGFHDHPRRSRSRNPNDSDEIGVATKKRRLKEEDASWSERAAAILLEVWGEKFVREGRRSLRSEEWRDVAERVSHAARIDATEAQCRAVLETMKNRYKEERQKFVELGIPSGWGYFRKMEGFLFAGPSRRGGGLACGLDSGEFVFADSKAYLEDANGFDEMRDSPAESEESGEESGDSGESVRVLAESVERFREIYGKVESDKRRQVVELEKMRMDFQRDLEIQKRQIMDRTRVEIAKIRAATPEEEHCDDEDEDEDEDEDGDGDGDEDDDEISSGGR